MTSSPLVSVVIIFFNAEKYLLEAIESVLTQTYDHWELFLVDDGSTDDSARIARFYAERYPGNVVCLQHPNGDNRGMCASRNLGIRQATGKYLAFLDADDIWLPQKLQEQVAILEAHPEAGMLYGRTEYWYSWNKDSAERKRDFVPALGVPPDALIEPPELLPLFLRGKASVPCICSILIRRSVIHEVGAFEDSFTGLYEDQAFYSKVCLGTTILASDRCWDRYRQHPESSVAVAAQAGLETAARQFFLEWLQDYLIGRQVKDLAVRQALQREMWRIRHPVWLPANARARSVVRRIKKWLLRIEENALPAVVGRRIWFRNGLRAGPELPRSARHSPGSKAPNYASSSESLEVSTASAFAHPESGADGSAEREESLVQRPSAQTANLESQLGDAIPVTMVAIIILSLNQRETTLQCLASLRSSNTLNQRVLLWDNGSSDGTSEAVRRAFPDVYVHKHPANLGVASGRNAAASLAIETFRPSHLLFLDNDMIVEEGFVEALAAPFAANPRISQTQAKLRLMADRGRLNDGGGARISFLLCQASPIGFGEIDRGQYDLARECIAFGGSTMVRADLFQNLGGFDPQFDPFGPEDIDFSLRLRKAGYTALFVPDAVAYHKISHTFGKGYTSLYARLKSRHWLQLMRRHATRWQTINFVLFGMPYVALCVIIREGKRGNFSALFGLFHGFLDFFSPSLRSRERS